MPRRSATNRSCRAIPKTGSVFLNAPLSLCAFILSHLPAFVKSRRDGIINERFGFPRGFLCFFHRTKIFITLCVGTERDGSGKFPFVRCRGGACPSRHCTGGKCGPMLKRQWPPSLSLRGGRRPTWQSREGTSSSYKVPIKTHRPIASVAALTAQPLAALPPYGCGVPFTGSERLAGWQCLRHKFIGAMPSGLSLRGGRRPTWQSREGTRSPYKPPLKWKRPKYGV